MPEISVIVPVYKAEPYLKRCVDSLLGQSCPDFELILVNDGSPDRSGEMCEEYAGLDSRIRVFHKENGGQATARNMAIEWVFHNSDSRWFAFVDSDDWVHRDYLKILLNAARKWDVKIATCEYLCTESWQKDVPVTSDTSFVVDADTGIAEYYSTCMSPCCKLYARELFSDLRFREGKRYEDAFITHIPIIEAGQIAVLTDELYYYYENPASSTRKKWTVRNLDQIEAHEARVKYCEEKGLYKAFCRELEELVISYYTQAVELTAYVKEDPSCRTHLQALKPTLRPVLRRAKQHGLIPFNRTFLWIYEIAYPVKPVWILRNLLEKVFGFPYPK